MVLGQIVVDPPKFKNETLQHTDLASECRKSHFRVPQQSVYLAPLSLKSSICPSGMITEAFVKVWENLKNLWKQLPVPMATVAVACLILFQSNQMFSSISIDSLLKLSNVQRSWQVPCEFWQVLLLQLLLKTIALSAERGRT